jgi:hypothetical protein
MDAITDEQLLELIALELWPREDPEQPWSPDTVQTIADLITSHHPTLCPLI